MNINGLEISVTKSNRKTVSIFIERDGSVSARIPEALSESETKEVLESKEYQIHKNKAEWEQLNERYVLREFVNGQSFLYLGRNYRLKLVDEKLGKVILFQGRFLLSKKEIDFANDYFIDFYKRKLIEHIKPLVKRYKKQLGVEPKNIKVMELKNRWASCSTKGNIQFHWKCAMAPIDVLHYIVVHELTHLIHMNHTPDFWNEIDKILPNYNRQKNWLKLNGSGMNL